MAKIIDLKTQRHARASAISRAARAAASPASNSADSPAECATGDAKTAGHHCGGMRRLCHHLLTSLESTPSSAAMASRVPQSSTTSRNDPMDMGTSLRPFVLKSKPTLSHDVTPGDGFNRHVGKTEHKQRFMERVTAAREQRGLTQEQIAVVLGMKQTKYHKYESRSYLPHDLIHRFCLATGVDVHWLVTGQNRPAEKQERVAISTGSKKSAKSRKSA